jgi:hypothetical protein
MRLAIRLLILTLLTALLPIAIWSQSESSEEITVVEVDSESETSEEDSPEEESEGESEEVEKRFKFTILAGPGYTPEMGFVLGGGFLMSWYTGDNPDTVTRSSMPVMFTVASAGGYSFSIRLKSFWLEDKLRWDTDFRLKDMNDNYWGVGYDAGKNVPEGDATAYRRFWWLFKPTVAWRLFPHFYVGGRWELSQTIATEVNPVMESDPYYSQYGSDNFNSGLGVVVQYDTRDFPQNAWSGYLLEASATFFSTYFGSDNNYQALTLDYRQYQTLWRPGAVLAWQVFTRGSWGNVPWDELSRVGSVFDLRGYYEGRYRDRMVLWGLVEYRHTFTKKDGSLSKHGFVGWAGLGTLGHDYMSLYGALPNLGVGYRFEVQPRLNVRFDLGWGMDTFGVYFNFQEAF